MKVIATNKRPFDGIFDHANDFLESGKVSIWSLLACVIYSPWVPPLKLPLHVLYCCTLVPRRWVRVVWMRKDHIERCASADCVRHDVSLITNPISGLSLSNSDGK